MLKTVCDVIETSLGYSGKCGLPSLVLTFNYDTLVEHELRLRGVPVQSIDRRVDFDTLEPGTVYVIHAHGILDDNGSTDGTIVFTEQSYGDAYLKDRGADPFSSVLAAGLRPLFVGFSFHDHFVRQILHRYAILRSEPVAIGILATHDLVDATDLLVSSSAWQGFSPNDRVGWTKTGNNPIDERQRTLTSIPEQLARWILHSVGVEWWKVPDRDSIPAAMAEVL